MWNDDLNVERDFLVHPRQSMCPALLSAERGYPVYLSDVYDSYSSAKETAWEYCRELCEKYNGKDFVITGHNCMTFSVAFDFMHPETGEYMTARITKSYNHAYYVHNC